MLKLVRIFALGLALAALAPAAAQQDAQTARFVAVPEQPQRPEIVLNDPNGTAHSIAEWDGQVLLVDFWASWCIPCKAEMPAFNRLRAAYRDRGFEVIGIAADDLDKVQNFLAEVPVDFPILYGEVFDVMDISAEYGNPYGGLPFNVFVDREGKIRYIQRPGEVSYEEAEEILLRLL